MLRRNDINRQALRSFAWLLLLAGAGFAIYALQSRPPGAKELQSAELAVESFDEVVMPNNNQHLGYAIFLGDAKPKAWASSSWTNDATTVLFHADAGVDEEVLAALNTHAPRAMTITSWNGLAVGVETNQRVLLSPADFRDRLSRLQRTRAVIAGALVVAAVGAAYLGFRKPKGQGAINGLH